MVPRVEVGNPNHEGDVPPPLIAVLEEEACHGSLSVVLIEVRCQYHSMVRQGLCSAQEGGICGVGAAKVSLLDSNLLSDELHMYVQ